MLSGHSSVLKLQMFRPVQLIVLAAKGKTGFWFLDRGSYTNGRAVKIVSCQSSVLKHKPIQNSTTSPTLLMRLSCPVLGEFQTADSLVLSKIEEGMVCLVHFSDQWYRAKVMEVFPEDRVRNFSVSVA